MNLLLCIGIIMLCGYIGRQLANRAAQRLNFFREYESSMVSLTDSITGVNLELSRALEASCGKTIGAVFRECARRLRETPKQRFAAIWSECFQQQLPRSLLNKEDTRVILDAGEAIEALCKNPSRSQASGYMKRLNGYITEMETEKRKKSKLFSAGGVLAGLLIALIVI